MVELIQEDIDRLLHTIYQAGLDPSLWSTFVYQLSELMAGTMIVMQGHDVVANASLGALSSPVDQELISSYDEYYAAKNVWVPGIAKMPIGKAGHPEDTVDREDLWKTEFYNDWLRPLGGFDTASGIVLHRDANRFLILSGNIRPQDAEAIRTPLQQLLDLIAPHIARSFEMMRALPKSIAQAEYQFATELVSDPVFFLDAAGRLMHTNGAGETLSRSDNAIGFTAGDGVFLRDPRADAKLRAALHAIAVGDYLNLGGTFWARRTDGVLMRAILTPFAKRLAPHRAFAQILDDLPIAILVLRTPVDRAHHQRAASRFRLTPAELALAIEVSHGTSLLDYAESRKLSIHTVRNQLKSIYSKTDTHRQSELAAVMLN